MPRTKKTDESSGNGHSAPVDNDGFYYLPKPLLMEYRAADAECRHAHLLLRVCGQDLDALLAKHPDIRQKITDKATMVVEAANRKNALTEVHQMIEVIYGIKITEIGIDDLTGRIHQLADGKLAPEGMKPAPVPKKRPGRPAKAKTIT